MRRYVKPADLNCTGPQLLRPYHLPYRVDFGLRGTPDVDRTLIGLPSLYPGKFVILLVGETVHLRRCSMHLRSSYA